MRLEIRNGRNGVGKGVSIYNAALGVTHDRKNA